MVLVESLVWGEPFAVRRSPRRSNVKRASSPVAFDGAVTHLQKFHSLQSRNDGRGRPSHNVETSPQGARRSTTSFIPFAVRRSPRRSNVKRASSPVAFDGAVTHLQKFNSLQSRNDGRGRPSHNVETSSQGARRSTTSFIQFAVWSLESAFGVGVRWALRMASHRPHRHPDTKP